MKLECDTEGHHPAAEARYCARVTDERGFTVAVNMCVACAAVARTRFPNLQIVPLYTVSRDLPSTTRTSV